MEELSVLSIAALEKAMWLLKSQQSTVDIMRGQQDAVIKQVLEVQMVMQGLLKARQRAEEARKLLQRLTMKTNKLLLQWHVHVQLILQQLCQCQEDVFQRSAFDILQGSAMDLNLTDEEAVFFASCNGFWCNR